MDIEKRNINGLQIKTVGQLVKLTKGQSALLKSIRDCVQNGRVIGWDIIVDVFYNNVNKNVGDSRYVGRYLDGTGRYEYFQVDIKNCYIEKNSKWQHIVKPRIRQWFVSTIGILVIKNQLIVIPTIDINEDDYINKIE